MKVFPMPKAPAVLGTSSFEFIEAEVLALQPTIGRYPPVFVSEKVRDQLYERWSHALIAARTLNTEGNLLERKLYLLAELYRQGHNLDVRGAAPEAEAYIERCIELFPQSRGCHLSASFFYLSTTGPSDRFERAERSLTVLRALAAPRLDDDAEAGFIWLAIYRGDMPEADHLIDRYLEAFPESSRTTMFRRIKDGATVETREWSGP